jgi:hypothetical protein
MSINTEIVTAIASWLGADDAIQRVVQRIAQRALLLIPIFPVGTADNFGRGSAPTITAGSGPNLYEFSGALR